MVMRFVLSLSPSWTSNISNVIGAIRDAAIKQLDIIAVARYIR